MISTIHPNTLYVSNKQINVFDLRAGVVFN